MGVAVAICLCMCKISLPCRHFSEKAAYGSRWDSNSVSAHSEAIAMTT